MTTQGEGQLIGVRDLYQILLRRRWWVVVAAVVGAAIGLGIALTAIPKYRADVLLQPIKRSSSGGGMQALSGTLGGLASLAGLDLGGGDDTQLAIATLKSRRLTTRFIEEKNLLPVLFAELWDAGQKRWKVADPEKAPRASSAESYFSSKVRRITEGRSGGFLTLTIEWTDPKLAAKWATELVSFANDFLRREALATAQQNIAFLEKQLQTTNIVEIRMSLNRLLEEQLNRLMLAKGEAEYAFKTIDPAIVPSGKANMPGNRIVLIWTIAGILLACIVAVAEAVLWRVSPPGIKGG
jgi:uncharacterized protein involved in exopolysaccharide biosynthesis